MALLQMFWDRAEANGYAQHMATDPLPNTPAHQVLIHAALGDFQVTNFSAEFPHDGARVHGHRALPGPSLGQSTAVLRARRDAA